LPNYEHKPIEVKMTKLIGKKEIKEESPGKIVPTEEAADI